MTANKTQRMSGDDLKLISKAIHLKRLAEAAGFDPRSLARALSLGNMSTRLSNQLRDALAANSLALLRDHPSPESLQWQMGDLRAAKRLFDGEALGRLIGCTRSRLLADYLSVRKPLSQGCRDDLDRALAKCGLAIIAASMSKPECSEVDMILDAADSFDGELKTTGEVVGKVHEELYQISAASVAGNPSPDNRGRYITIAAICVHASREGL